jgi:hypothetical protein
MVAQADLWRCPGRIDDRASQGWLIDKKIEDTGNEQNKGNASPNNNGFFLHDTSKREYESLLYSLPEGVRTWN